MESEKAHKSLLILTKKYKFYELHSHIKNIGPLKIKLKKLIKISKRFILLLLKYGFGEKGGLRVLNHF